MTRTEAVATLRLYREGLTTNRPSVSAVRDPPKLISGIVTECSHFTAALLKNTYPQRSVEQNHFSSQGESLVPFTRHPPLPCVLTRHLLAGLFSSSPPVHQPGSDEVAPSVSGKHSFLHLVDSVVSTASRLADRCCFLGGGSLRSRA